MTKAATTLPGRHVLWPLIALATSTALQNSPADRAAFAHYDSLSPASTSPLVCLADIFVTIVYVATAWLSGLPLREAMGFYLKHFKLAPEQDESHSSRSVLILKLAFFVLGVVPQAIKLFAARGIPWAQVIASTYIVALMLRASIFYFGRPRLGYRPLEDSTPQKLKDRIRSMDPWTSAVFESAIEIQTFFPAIHLGHTSSQHVTAYILFSMLAALTSFFSIKFGDTVDALEWTRSSILGFNMWMITYYYIYLCQDCFDSRYYLQMVNMILLVLVGEIMPSVFMRGRRRFYYVYLALMNLIAAVVYFTLCYDSSGTYQYSWTDYVG